MQFEEGYSLRKGRGRVARLKCQLGEGMEEGKEVRYSLRGGGGGYPYSLGEEDLEEGGEAGYSLEEGEGGGYSGSLGLGLGSSFDTH